MAMPYFPATYGINSYPYQSQIMQNYQQQIGQSNIIAAWVQGGEQSMKSFPLGTNQKAFLFSTEDNIFGVKSTDANGMPFPLDMFRYEKINEAKSESEVAQETRAEASLDLSAYVRRDELESRINEILAAKRSPDNQQRNDNNGGSLNGK